MALPTPQDPVPVDQLAQLDYDKGAFFFALIPLVIIGILCLAGLVLYFFRKGKNWNEIGEEMRVPDDEVIVQTTADDEPFSAARGDLRPKSSHAIAVSDKPGSK